jgi:hypothetical protein
VTIVPEIFLGLGNLPFVQIGEALLMDGAMLHHQGNVGVVYWAAFVAGDKNAAPAIVIRV